MRARGWLLVLLVVARGAAGHIIPIDPSHCVLDPVEIVAPATGVSATVASPAAADQVVIRYDTQASQAQFDLTAVPPRSFVAAGVSGTFALPSFFSAALTHSGDLTATVPVVFAMNASTVAVPLMLTTGLAAASTTMVEGAPIGPDGRFTLVGLTASSGLGPPFGPGMLSVRLGCQATPRPDTDQFAGQTTPLSGNLSAQTLKLRAIFAPGGTTTPDFPGGPAILRVTSGGTVVATAYLPAGLAQHGRSLFVGRSDDGRAAVGVRTLHRSGQLSFLMAVRIQGATPPTASTTPVPVDITYEVGGFLSRMSLPFRVKRHGTRLHFP